MRVSDIVKLANSSLLLLLKVQKYPQKYQKYFSIVSILNIILDWKKQETLHNHVKEAWLLPDLSYQIRRSHSRNENKLELIYKIQVRFFWNTW